MTKNPETGSLDVAHGAEQFFRLEPRIVEIAEIDVRTVMNIDSSNAIPEHWEQIGQAIAECLRYLVQQSTPFAGVE